MTENDLSDALELSVAQGWNQTAADWQRLLRLEPSGCFAARVADRLIGTVTTTTYGRSLAWIGMLIVHPDFRRRGVGAELTRSALESLQRLGVRNSKLDATPAGRPLYESLGFVVEAEIERWRGVAGRARSHESPATDGVSLAPVAELDRLAYGADRSSLLERLVADGVFDPLVVRSSGGDAEAFVLARRGRTAAYVGPLVSRTREAAEELVDDVLARFTGEPVCLDLHRGGRIRPRALAERGLSKQRSLTRMRFGPDAGAGRSRSLCASAGPELG